SDPYKIYESVSQKLKRIPLNESIGLHYTGGTKTMSVHTYRAIHDSKHHSVFSYLDARTMTLKIEPTAGEQTQDIELQVWPEGPEYGKPPRILDLTALHGENLNSDFLSNEIILGDMAGQLVTACADIHVAQQWRSWCNKQIRGANVYDRKRGDWLPERKLRGVTLLWPEEVELRSILQRKFRQNNERAMNLEDAATAVNFKECKALCRWLDGLWLEYYVLDCINKMHEQAQIHDW
ncbi:MAG: hypothetical protein KDE46_30725, partial [Caldilineaceae bacterium]|nr:hypothetical protein [Caldilineaceae bacterium]